MRRRAPRVLGSTEPPAAPRHDVTDPRPRVIAGTRLGGAYAALTMRRDEELGHKYVAL